MPTKAIPARIRYRPTRRSKAGRRRGGDRHVLVVDRDGGKLYELFAAYPESRRRLARRIGRDLRSEQQCAAAGDLDLRRRGRAADPARPGALRGGGCRRDPARAALHRAADAQRLRLAGATPGIEPRRRQLSADGTALSSEGERRHFGLRSECAGDPASAQEVRHVPRRQRQQLVPERRARPALGRRRAASARTPDRQRFRGRRRIVPDGRPEFRRHHACGAAPRRRGSAGASNTSAAQGAIISSPPTAAKSRRSTAGRIAGWVRTGQMFHAYAAESVLQADMSPVCRFYGRAEAGQHSHFFSAYVDECAAVASWLSSEWLLESANVFVVSLPVARDGSCAPGNVPVYRLYNNDRRVGRSSLHHVGGDTVANDGRRLDGRGIRSRCGGDVRARAIAASGPIPASPGRLAYPLGCTRRCAVPSRLPGAVAAAGAAYRAGAAAVPRDIPAASAQRKVFFQ